MKTLQRFCLFALGTWIPLLTFAQTDSSYLLPDMLVKGVRFKQFQTGVFVQDIDSIAFINNRSLNLDQLLSQNSGIFVKSYGPSQISSASSRGSNAQQNAVIWNGFNISNPMLGMQDLSLLPVFLFDALSIQYGAQASLFGSGNMGSTMQLATTKTNNQGIRINLLNTIGSFGEINTGIKTIWAKPNWQIHEKVFIQKAENNFHYLDASGIKKTMKFAAGNQFAWMQDLFFHAGKKHSFQLNTWLQKNDRQIPPADITLDQSTNQVDFSTRINAEYAFKQGAYQLLYRAAYFNDEINFTDIGKIENKSIGEQINQAIDQTYSGKNFRVLLSTQIQYFTGISEAYSETKKRDTKALFGSIKKSLFNQNLQLELAARQEWYKGNLIPFIPTFSIQWKTFGMLETRARLGRNYRLPTLNDLYWVPGGNTNLQAENGTFFEAGFSFAKLNSKLPHFHINLYNRKTENQISWIPITSSRWEVINIGKVNTYGIEIFWDYQLKIKALLISLKAQHDFCKALNKTSSDDPGYNKQLIYIPRIKHNLQLVLSYYTWNISYTHQYVGQRFYSSDNIESLDEYALGNIFISKKITHKKHSFLLQLKRYNCFGINYEIVKNRPMPGASNQLSIQYQF